VSDGGTQVLRTRVYKLGERQGGQLVDVPYRAKHL
jgi:hypothetical protein